MAMPPGALIGSGDGQVDFAVILILGGGIVGGLILLGRGLADYRAGGRIRGISTSRIASIAVGEVLVSGTAEPIELTLVSPLQSAPCLFYRARVTDSSSEGGDVFHEERAVGFRISDGTGSVRVFPGRATFDVPDRFDEEGGRWDGDPPGLMPRTGSAFGPGIDRESQIAALLTVRDPGRDPWSTPFTTAAQTPFGKVSLLTAGSSHRHYTEGRIEAGDVVTIVGRALPFGDLSDPAAANILDEAMVPAGDAEVAADLAEARAAGLLAATPEEAWGNAAIEGFGIGRPARQPELDPAATLPPPPDPAIAARARDAFDIAPETLVLAGSSDAALFVSLGAPAAVTDRHRGTIVVGLVGGVVAIVSAMALAILATGAG